MVLWSSGTCQYAYVKSKTSPLFILRLFELSRLLLRRYWAFDTNFMFLFVYFPWFKLQISATVFLLWLRLGTRFFTEHSCNLILCPFLVKRFSCLFALSCRLIGTRRPFCCTGFNASKNLALTYFLHSCTHIWIQLTEVRLLFIYPHTPLFISVNRKEASARSKDKRLLNLPVVCTETRKSSYAIYLLNRSIFWHWIS